MLEPVGCRGEGWEGGTKGWRGEGHDSAKEWWVTSYTSWCCATARGPPAHLSALVAVLLPSSRQPDLRCLDTKMVNLISAGYRCSLRPKTCLHLIWLHLRWVVWGLLWVALTFSKATVRKVDDGGAGLGKVINLWMKGRDGLARLV